MTAAEGTAEIRGLAWVSGALAWVAGFCDTASFVGAKGIFCAHVTGNFVVLASDLAGGARADEWLKLATFPLFVLAVVVATRLVARRGGGSAPTLLSVSAALLVAAALLAPAAQLAPRLVQALTVALLVLAMGTQNALHRHNPVLGPMTTVMTGNVTGFIADLAGRSPPSPAAAAKHRASGILIAGFALGCAAGALLVSRLGFVVLLVPALVTVLVRTRLPRP